LEGLIQKLSISGITSGKQTDFIFKNMLAEYATPAGLLKPLRTRRKPPNQTKNFFPLMRTIFDQDEKTNSQNDR
jgi:hypothetical protein